MEYREFAPPPAIAHLVSAAWTLEVGQAADGWVTHVATPDGCVEIIRRLNGRSVWMGEQPTAFVAGLITGPATLRLSSESRFLGLRIRPWTWNSLTGSPSRTLIDNWRDLDLFGGRVRMPESAANVFSVIRRDLLGEADAALANAILASSSVSELQTRSGRHRRWLQRWFEQNIGLSPRTYLRLLRFNETFSDLGRSTGSLADHAAAHGFADQAHMAREFRRMSGEAAVVARKRAQGPFL